MASAQNRGKNGKKNKGRKREVEGIDGFKKGLEITGIKTRNTRLNITRARFSQRNKKQHQFLEF